MKANPNGQENLNFDNQNFNQDFATNFARRVHNMFSNQLNTPNIFFETVTPRIIISHKSVSNNTEIIKFNRQNNENTRCVICIREMEDGDIVRRIKKCGHCFHINCIDKWFEENITCPHCRQDIRILNNEEEEEESDNEID